MRAAVSLFRSKKLSEVEFRHFVQSNTVCLQLLSVYADCVFAKVHQIGRDRSIYFRFGKQLNLVVEVYGAGEIKYICPPTYCLRH